MTRHERTVGSLQPEEAFSLDGGETWHSCAVNTASMGTIAVDAYPTLSRPGCIRIPIEGPDQPCLVDDSTTCGDCGRTVHLHKGTTTGYRHAPVTGAKPEWDTPCPAKPPYKVLNVCGVELPL